MSNSTFTDAAGRAWSIHFDYDAAVRMRDAGFDLRGAPAHLQQEMERLGDDHLTFVDVIAAALAPKIREQGVALHEFRNAISGGQPFEDASTAFLHAVGDFFPKLRPLIDAALTRIAPMLNETVAELTRQVAAGEMDATLRRASSERSGSVPASAASIPAATACAN